MPPHTKSRGRKSPVDAFYTRSSVAAACLEHLGDLSGFDLVVEPSAGSGAFSSLVPGCLAMDLEPAHPSVLRQDFLDPEMPWAGLPGRVLVLGNPPFGAQGHLAARFANRAAELAEVVAFVMPASYMKPAVQARLHSRLHLRSWLPLPRDAFLLAGEPYDVPCVFQVWERRPEVRADEPAPELPGLSFVGPGDSPDAWVRRVGARAGDAGTDCEGRNPRCHHFLRVGPELGLTAGELCALVRELDFPGRDMVAGPRSVGKAELLREVAGVLG